MRIFTVLSLLGLSLAVPAAAYAAPAAQEVPVMPEVEVKAKAMPGSLTSPGKETARQNLNRVPGGTSLVDAETYKLGRTSTLHDSLGFAPGVFVQPRFGSEEARLSIRGSGIQRTFHLRGIKLLQDGVPLNQADGGGDFQSIEPLALDHIEVYRGANALEYGSTTLGGAVNFISPTGYDAALAQARLEVGSFNYLREQISSGEVLGPVDYYVSLSESRQDGFRNHAQQWNKRLFSNAGIKLGDNAETRFYISAMDSKSMLPGTLTKTQMKQNPRQNAAANAAQNQKRDFDLVRLANKTVFDWDDQRVELGVFWLRKDLFHPIFQVLDVLTDDLGGSVKYQNRKDLFDRKSIFTFGFNPAFGFTEDIRHTNAGGQRGTRTAEAKQKSRNLDFYGEEQFYAFEKLALIGGVQWSFASRKSRDKFLSDGDHSGHPTYHGISPKGGLRYEFNERSQAFFNFSRSFEPPSFGELTNVTGGGLRELKEQRASTIEVGTRGQEGIISWDLAYYYSWVENELLGLNDGAGNPLGTVNAASTRHQGIETGLGIDLLRGILVNDKEAAESEAAAAVEEDQPLWEDLLGIERHPQGQDRVVLRGVYNWSRFRFVNDPAYSDNPLPGIPEHFTRFELVYEHPRGFYLGPNVEWSFKQYAADMNNTLFAKPYALLGLKGGYRTKKGISFFVEGRNLTNEIYASTTGIIADARGLDSAQFYPGDGRSVYSGIEIRWG